MPHTPLFRRLMAAFQQAHWENLSPEGKSAPIMKSQAGYTRRQFIKTTILTAAAGAVSGSLPPSVWSLTPTGLKTDSRVAIIGGGIAGLNAAYQLKKAGIRATVYEARRRIGGRILSVSGAVGEGLVTDLGGELINTDHKDMLRLVREFDLEFFNRIENAEDLPFPRTGYFFDGVAHSEAVVAKDLRALAAQIAKDSKRIDEDFERFAPRLDRLSVKDYLDRHADLIPKAYIRTLIEASIRTEYGVEPKDSSALQLIFNLPTVKGQAVEVLGNSDETFAIKGGSGKIIEGLAQKLNGRIRLKMELTRLRAREDGFRMTFANGETINADFVILAIPFPVLREVDLDVPLPRRLKRFIHEFDLGRNEKLIAGFEERTWRQSKGFVTEAWTDLDFSEVWDETQRQPGRKNAALTFYLGGREVSALRGESARSVGRVFVERLNEVIPGIEPASTDQFISTHWRRSPFTRGAYANFKPGQLTEFGRWLWIESKEAGERQEVHAGNLIFAGEHLSDAFYGFMNGAAQTGRLAANLVARRIAEQTVVLERELERSVA